MAATFRRCYGVSIYELGYRLGWREALALVEDALGDASTPLGAAVGKLTYRHTPVELALLAAARALVGKGLDSLLPAIIEDKEDGAGGESSESEVAAALARLDESIVWG